MGHPFFALISRMRYIGRWGLMRNSFQENIQEHSHMVAVLAHGLAVIARDIYGKDVDPGEVTIFALYHDAPEILTGDLPTPVKYLNPDIRDAYKEVEQVSARRLTAMLPEELRATYAPILAEETAPYVHELVKVADRLSAYIKCVEELKTGNREFQKASEQCLKDLEKCELPEVKYFMEQFLPDFSLTLDDIQGWDL